MGYSVLLSNYRRYFKVANYLATFTRESIVIALGLPGLVVGLHLLSVFASIGAFEVIENSLWRFDFQCRPKEIASR